MIYIFCFIFRLLGNNDDFVQNDYIDDELALLNLIKTGVQQRKLFDDAQCLEIERKIDKVVQKGEKGKYKACTVDRAPLRNK